MACKNNEEVISKVSPHTVKKFDLIEKYVEAWIQKLMNWPNCEKVVFVDCMCNSGMYIDDNGNEIHGTPIRVAEIMSRVMLHYPKKKAKLYFNDIDERKIKELEKHLPPNTDNFQILTSHEDGNDLLKKISETIPTSYRTNYLVVYDPYMAAINWDALLPFLNNWGEVIINHMVSDSIRGVSQARRQNVIDKYEQTYLTDIEELVTFGSDKDAFERRIEAIIKSLHRGGNRYYVASFPFFNTRNALVYNLLHCTNSVVGFKLYKTTAWKTFGDKSSTKNTHGMENQLVLDFSGDNNIVATTTSDEYCYYIQDVVEYLMKKYNGKSDVELENIWKDLDEHPVFPTDGYKNDIKMQLKSCGNIIKKNKVTFVRR